MRLIASLLDACLAVPPARVKTANAVVAVSRFDEDVVTLAAEAGLGLDQENPGPAALVVATVSSPRVEGGIAPIVAEILGIEAMALECSGTVAAGGDALVTGMGLLAAGIEPVLVIATDLRYDPEGKPLGAGAVAMLIGTTGDGGTITHSGSQAGWFPDVWRAAGSRMPTYGDRSFARYSPTSQAAAAGTNAIGPTGPAFPRIGALGTAGLGASLLLSSEPGEERIAIGGGGLLQSFTFTPGPDTARLRGAASKAAAGGDEVAMPAEVAVEGFHPYSSEPRSWRERRQDLYLEGNRDRSTGEVFFPPVPANSGLDLEPFRLGRRGKVVTHTRDHVYPVGGPLSMVVVDIEGGGRFFGQTAWDFPVSIDMPVRLVPRLLHLGGGIPQYFWKVVPL